MIPARQSGFTLVEIVITSTLVSLLAGGIYALLNTGVDTYGTGVTNAEIQRQTNRVVEQITEAVSTAGRDVLFPQPVAPNSRPHFRSPFATP